jgi:hypothetical protein
MAALQIELDTARSENKELHRKFETLELKVQKGDFERKEAEQHREKEIKQSKMVIDTARSENEELRLKCKKLEVEVKAGDFERKEAAQHREKEIELSKMLIDTTIEAKEKVRAEMKDLNICLKNEIENHAKEKKTLIEHAGRSLYAAVCSWLGLCWFQIETSAVLVSLHQHCACVLLQKNNWTNSRPWPIGKDKPLCTSASKCSKRVSTRCKRKY